MQLCTLHVRARAFRAAFASFLVRADIEMFSVACCRRTMESGTWSSFAPFVTRNQTDPSQCSKTSNCLRPQTFNLRKTSLGECSKISCMLPRLPQVLIAFLSGQDLSRIRHKLLLLVRSSLENVLLWSLRRVTCRSWTCTILWWVRVGGHRLLLNDVIMLISVMFSNILYKIPKLWPIHIKTPLWITRCVSSRINVICGHPRYEESRV